MTKAIAAVLAGHARPDANKHSSKVWILRLLIRKQWRLLRKISLFILYALGDLSTMRPSSSSDSNAPHRATSPVFIDFFAKEAAEQQERTAPVGQHSPFAELNPRGTSAESHPAGSVAAGPSAHFPVTVNSLRCYLQSKGYSAGSHIFDVTIQNRLNTANLSAETLLTALEIAHTPDHPLLVTLGVNKSERLRLINRLKGIVNHSAGFQTEIESAALRSHNQPNQLIQNFLELVR